MKIISKIFLILIVGLTTSALFAQSDLSFGSKKPEIKTFVYKVEGAGFLSASLQAADGGYVTISRISRVSFLARKIKVSGQKQWERRLNFDDSQPYYVASIDGIAQTTDGGFVLVGADQLVKLDPNGTILWKKGVGGIPWFASLAATPDGGVVGTAVIPSDEKVTDRFLLIRFTSTGNILWKKKFAGLPHDWSFTFPSVPTDNGLIVAIPTPNGVDVIKVNNSGKVVWKKSLVTDGFVFQSVGATADNGIILAGRCANCPNKLFVVVLKANGTLNWNAEYSLKVPGRIKSVSSPIQTADGGYVVTGHTFVNSGRINQGFIAKIDSSRKIAFQNTLGITNEPVVGVSVFATADGGFVIFGEGELRLQTDLFVLKLNSEGIVPGCALLPTQQFGSSTQDSFGPLTFGQVNLTAAADLSLESFDFVLSSAVTNYPVSTRCH